MSITATLRWSPAASEADHLLPSRLIPLDRYRSITGHLDEQGLPPLDYAWLRFAVHVAILHPDDPGNIARQITALSGLLQKEAVWFRDLATPMRYVIAAMLVRQNIPFAHFLVHHTQSISILRDEGLKSGDFNEAMAVLILHMKPREKPFNRGEAKRIKSIYDCMKKMHWWLTGANDLPLCAALSLCQGSPERLVAQCEEIYRHLRLLGMSNGFHLKNAAHILAMNSIPVEQRMDRWMAIHDAMEHHVGPLNADKYEILSILALLDHQPDWIIRKFFAVSNELDLLQHPLSGLANHIIAADLTVLDLMRFDDNNESFSDAGAIDGMLRTLHLYHISSAVVISQLRVDLIPEEFASMAAFQA
jgi:hypothetical protein